MLNTKTLIVGAAIVIASSLLVKKIFNSTPVSPEEVVVARTTLTSTSESTDITVADKAKVIRLEPESEQVLILDTQVDAESVEILISQIQTLEKEYKELYLVIDSPGGSVFDGARLISYMEASKAKINTVCYSLCASMASQIHAHGVKRYMVDRSALMFHSAAGGVRGTVPSMKSLLSYIDREVQKLDAYVADRANIKRDEFGNLVIRDMWISADDALRMKLTDALAVIALNRDQEDTFVLSRELFKRNKIPIDTTNRFNPLSEIY